MNQAPTLGIIYCEFNSAINELLLAGTLSRLAAANIPDENLTVIQVPGAVEIPWVAQRLAKQDKFDAIISLGCVIRGETSHYDYVCQQVSQGCQQIALTHDIPVIFGILTTENETQAMDRLGGKQGHKGIDAAEAALRMIAIEREFFSPK